MKDCFSFLSNANFVLIAHSQVQSPSQFYPITENKLPITIKLKIISNILRKSTLIKHQKYGITPEQGI
jgi:hypothetical protein